MKVASLTQALNAANFDILLASVRKVTGFDEEKNKFEKGTLAEKT